MILIANKTKESLIKVSFPAAGGGRHP